MQLPKFVLADNSDFPEDIFIVHLDFKDMTKIELKPIQMKYLTFNEDYINSVKSS